MESAPILFVFREILNQRNKNHNKLRLTFYVSIFSFLRHKKLLNISPVDELIK